MTCLHNHDQILEYQGEIFLEGFQNYQNYLCALTTMMYTLLGSMQISKYIFCDCFIFVWDVSKHVLFSFERFSTRYYCGSMGIID